MSSSDEYQHYQFSQELLNIDTTVDELDNKLNNIIEQIKEFAILGEKLKNHNNMYKYTWAQHNINKYNEILEKCKNLDNFLYENF